MRRVFILILSGLAGSLALGPAMLAKWPDPADYPLRVHILHYNSHAPDARDSMKNSGMADYVAGEGHADLFERGQPLGFSFSNSCTNPVRVSEGYATLPARWKKKDKSLQILVPEPGKPWNAESCELQVEPRPGLAYFWTEDSVKEESAAVFKDWMVKHHYDPEKGMDDPVDVAPVGEGTGETGSSSSQPGTPQ